MTTLVYNVDYKITSRFYDTERRSAKVQVIEGYSTFGDIPKIIATTQGVKASEVQIVFVDLVGIKEHPS